MRRHNQNRREDNIEKRPLTQDDIDFLRDLQEEMNEQDTVCQADPRFWVIRGTETVYGTADGEPCICTHDAYPATEMDDWAKMIDRRLKDLYGEEGNEAKCYHGSYIEVYVDGEETDSLFDVDEVVEWMKDHEMDVWASTVEKVPRNYPGTFFLTLRDAEDHLEANYYHYSDDAHPYAMTAWRDPTTEKLWKILQETDWKTCLQRDGAGLDADDWYLIERFGMTKKAIARVMQNAMNKIDSEVEQFAEAIDPDHDTLDRLFDDPAWDDDGNLTWKSYGAKAAFSIFQDIISWNTPFGGKGSACEACEMAGIDGWEPLRKEKE